MAIPPGGHVDGQGLEGLVPRQAHDDAAAVGRAVQQVGLVCCGTKNVE